MINSLVNVTGVAIARAIPGLLSFACILLIGSRLSTSDFGLYSTFAASTNLLASIAYGPIQFSIVSSYAKAEAGGHGSSYMSTVMILSVLLSLFLWICSGFFGVFHEYLVMACYLVATFGLLQVIQELLRARMRFYSYIVCSIVQSLSFLALVFYQLDSNSSFEHALIFFALSNGSAIFVGLLLSGFTAAKPQLGFFSEMRSVGFPYTFSTICENVIFVGFRYAIMFFGSPAQLGIFSYCVELAQRSLGYIVSVTGFVLVPRAFKLAQGRDDRQFLKDLVAAAALSSTLAVLVLVAILTLVESGLASKFELGSFSTVTFTVVGLAIILNRVKKILIDPYLMRHSGTRFLGYGYAIAGALMLPVACVALVLELDLLFDLAYLSGYLLAAFFSILLFRKSGKYQNRSGG